MDMTTVLIIVIVVILLGGGGFYGRGRWWSDCVVSGNQRPTWADNTDCDHDNQDVGLPLTTSPALKRNRPRCPRTALATLSRGPE
jgi:hypothetical protein